MEWIETFKQMFISLYLMSKQKEDNPDLFISQLLPLAFHFKSNSDREPAGNIFAADSTSF